MIDHILTYFAIRIVADPGAVTSLAFSSDHTHIASGHENGHLFVWRVNKPVAPRFYIPPISPISVSSSSSSSNKEGHVFGAAILHVGFVGRRHSAIVSADNRGMAFSHINMQNIVQKSMQSTRLLGRYPPGFIKSSVPKQKKATSVLAFASLMQGNTPHATDSRGLVAIMSPHILVIISTSPIPQTIYKIGRPKSISDTMGLSGCLDWFHAAAPAKHLNGKPHYSEKVLEFSNPRLAYCWSNVVTILSVSAGADTNPRDNFAGKEMEFSLRKRFLADEAIVALQWLNSQVCHSFVDCKSTSF